MSEKAPFMVFSGTNSRYLAEKICASLNCPLGNMQMVNLLFLTRSQSVVHMYSWFNPLSQTLTI